MWRIWIDDRGEAGKFHSTDHGMNGQAQMTFKVAGNCMIKLEDVSLQDRMTSLY